MVSWKIINSKASDHTGQVCFACSRHWVVRYYLLTQFSLSPALEQVSALFLYLGFQRVTADARALAILSNWPNKLLRLGGQFNSPCNRTKERLIIIEFFSHSIRQHLEKSHLAVGYWHTDMSEVKWCSVSYAAPCMRDIIDYLRNCHLTTYWSD